MKRLRLLSIIMIIVLIGAIFTAGSYFVDYFIKDGTIIKADSKKDHTRLKRQEQEEREKKIDDLSFYYAMDTSECDIKVFEDKDAKEALVALQDKIHFTDAESSFELISSNSSADGKVFYIFQQKYDGIEVYGHTVKMLVDADGFVRYINGNCKEITNDFEAIFNYSEADAEEAGKRYINQKFKNNSKKDNVEFDKKIIYYDEDNNPQTGFLLHQGFYEIIVDGKTAEVIKYYSTMHFEGMTRGNLQGQEVKQTLDYYLLVSPEENNEASKILQHNNRFADRVEKEYILQDTERKIYCYYNDNPYNENGELEETDFEAIIEGEINRYTDMKSPMGIMNQGAPKSCVDFLANIERCYDYFDNVLGVKGMGNEESIYLIDNYYTFYDEKAREENRFVYDNAVYVGKNSEMAGFVACPKAIDTTVSCSFLDVCGHEYGHGIMDEKTLSGGEDSEEYGGISEGVADVFGELVEYYSSSEKDLEQTNGGCNWMIGNVIRYFNPSDIPNGAENEVIYDYPSYLERKEQIERQQEENGNVKNIDCHDLAGIASYPAYLIATGMEGDSDKKLSMPTLGKLFYNSLDYLVKGSNFAGYRMALEDAALDMKESHDLTYPQLECVLDALDRVGIEPSNVLEKGTMESTMKVFDAENEPLKNYHLLIKQRSVVYVDTDVASKEGEFTLPDDMLPGIYEVTIGNIENPDNKKTFTIMVNDNDDQDLVEDYKDEWEIYTNIRVVDDEKKNLVLVLDTSGSMRGESIEQMKTSASQFVSEVLAQNSSMHVSVVLYDDKASVLIEDSDDKDAIIQRIEGISADGLTNIYDGLHRAYAIVKDSDAKKNIIVVMSDGLPENNDGVDKEGIKKVKSLANEIKSNKKYVIYAMGFFNGLIDDPDDYATGVSLMQSVASTGYYYNVGKNGMQLAFEDLSKLVNGEQYVEVDVACPVDVIVTKGNETLSSAEDSYNIRTSFGSLSFIGEGSDQEKILRLYNGAEYNINIVGTSDGTMDYTISYPNKKGVYSDIRRFEQIPIKKNTMISSDTSRGMQTSLQVDSDGDGRFDRTYVTGKNKTGRRYYGIISYLPYILVILLIIAIIGKVRGIRKRIKQNKTCPTCGFIVPSNSQFCPIDGTPIVKVPIIRGEKIERKPENPFFKIVKVTIIAICLICIVSISFIRTMPASQAYQMIIHQNYLMGTALYEKGVSKSKINQKLFDLYMDSYKEKVEKAYKDGLCTEKDKEDFFHTISEL